MKYLKSFFVAVIPLFIFSVLITVLYYFDLLGKSMFNWVILVSLIVSLFIGGVYIGKNTSNKGYLEGMKLGLMIVVFFFISGFLMFDVMFSLKEFVYYVIIMISATLGSMFGINKRKDI